MNPSRYGQNEFLESPHHVRNMLYGLAFECPLGGNPPDCLIHQLRKESIPKRIQRIDEMTDKECLELYQRHLKCLCKKEENLSAESSESA